MSSLSSASRYLYMIALFFDAESVVHGTLMVITFLPLGASDFGLRGHAVRLGPHLAPAVETRR